MGFALLGELGGHPSIKQLMGVALSRSFGPLLGQRGVLAVKKILFDVAYVFLC